MLNNLNNHRNYLHTIPELALQEFKTSQYIRDVLDKEGVEYHTVDTSTIAFIRGNSDSCIAFRADIDALPLKEESNNPFKSKIDGMMHACGHDGHTAMLLAFIQEVKKMISNNIELKKSLLFIFEAGEEGAGGARFIINDNFYKSKNIEAIFALHVYPDINVGEFAIKSGCVSLQNINLDISLNGKGCHGAQPHKGIDSILIGAKLVEAYQSLKSRNIPSYEHFLLTIGAFHAGTVRNIIPESVNMLGTIRLENTALIPLIKNKIENINSGFEIAFDVNIDMKFEPFYPPVINDYNLFEKSLKALSKKVVYKDISLSGSEDFSFYLQNGTPGLFGLIGIKDAEHGYTSSLHNNNFDFNNESLVHGVQFYLDVLNELHSI
ncbi:M20 metallopeptidase family protein [Cetobacterium sp.]|uniref:M20 metallopeptidase family protein n=1 Tax=Cetobacterium sp. TaxID=2071632 RepID=UPI003F37A8AD